MADSNRDRASAAPLILDHSSFRARTAAELARVARSGGFLSLAAMGPASGGGSPGRDTLVEIGNHLRRSVRSHDVVGLHGTALTLILPDADAVQASLAGTRLLAVARVASGAAGADWGCGTATVYGQVEGGSQALLLAAAQALERVRPGEVGASDVLRGRPRVLLIDDDQTFCQALADTVCELGWDGFPCSDVADATTRIKEDDYEGLIVDLAIPGSDGLTLLREALSRRPRLPAVLVSGRNPSSDQVLEALSLGPVTFMRKPFPRTDVEAALKMFRALLPGSAPRRTSI